MKKWLLVAALALLPNLALALPSIVFDTTPGGAGGTLTYDGAGGPAVGTDIKFVDIVGVESPLNAGVTLACVDCVLNFTTGANTLEGPPQYIWAGGGSFVLTGDVPALGLDDAILLSGSFTGTPNTPGLAAGSTSALFVALGADTKNETLAGYYGFSPDNWNFANTEIALGTFTLGADGAFSAVPNQADLINAVPEPGTLLLLGTGLVGVVPLMRRIRR
jgi:PEP-CTERM motif